MARLSVYREQLTEEGREAGRSLMKREKELVGDQNPGPEAPLMSKEGRERREQRKCQGRSDCQKRGGEG